MPLNSFATRMNSVNGLACLYVTVEMGSIVRRLRTIWLQGLARGRGPNPTLTYCPFQYRFSNATRMNSVNDLAFPSYP